jgi:predicted nuclease with RNAse H fold
MPASRTSPVVVGIDVGGRRKGFHAVALEDGRYRERLATTEISELATWCVETLRATVIAVDAPCRWSTNKTGRPAERELMQQGIWCFSTPTSDTAHKPHPTDYYDWMLRGEALYEALRATHPVCKSWPARKRRCCFETFPHAITWHLRGGNADAKQKRTQRRELLKRHGIATEELTNMDWVDAALCAVTAHLAASRERLAAFGEAQTGLIIVPARP